MKFAKAFVLSVCFVVFAAAPAHAAQDIYAAPGAIKVLSDKDKSLYKEIFALQEKGAWKVADKKIAALDDKVLMGYVRYQRLMHPTDYRSSYKELKEWMAYYADHPEANKIYKLALKRRPKKSAPPLRPSPRKWRSSGGAEMHPALARDYENTSGPKLRRIEGRVRYLSKKERALDALKEIDKHKKRGVITARQYDRMRSWIAASLYYQGFVDTADKLATAVADRNGDSAVLAYWIAGLIDFRRGDMTAAYDRFAAMSAVPYQDDDLRSAAGFWAARSALAAGNFESVANNLKIAADLPFTFYGQLALAQLGRDHDYNWTAPIIDRAGFERLTEAVPRVRRAVALKEAGRDVDADTEMRWANGSIKKHRDQDLLAVATLLDLPAAQIDIALASNTEAVQSGLFPIPGYEPRGGFQTDRALLYALMRQESKFKVDATSRVGARGLMQLMPRTASYVANDRSLRSRAGRERLYDPGFNLQLGQSYVNYLIDNSARGDLFHMAAAYNGGPGNLRRWRRDVDIDDPLLFIESIPNPESRDFVEKVLTNFWVYRARLGQPAPSRDKVAAGELPLYEALDQIAGN